MALFTGTNTGPLFFLYVFLISIVIAFTMPPRRNDGVYLSKIRVLSIAKHWLLAA
jgi:hypothetical protein